MYPAPTCQALLKAVIQNGPRNSFTFPPTLPTKRLVSSNGPLCGKHFWVSVFNFRYLLRRDRSPRWWITSLSSVAEINSWPSKSPAGQLWKTMQAFWGKLIEASRCEMVHQVDTLARYSLMQDILQGITQVVCHTNIHTTNVCIEQTEIAKSQTQAHMC